MAIKEGFIKTKHRRKLSDGDYQLESRWTSASTVEMANGNTVETEMTTHDTANNTTAFTSADSTSAPDSTPPALITSGETHKSLFNKLSMAVKNVRWLLSKMGTTDLSGIGDGTVTNAISTLNSNLISYYDLLPISLESSFSRTRGNGYKFGKMRSLQIGIKTNADFENSWIDIGTVNDDYKPMSDVVGASSSMIPIQVRLEANGKLYLYPIGTWHSNDDCYISLTYCVN